MNSLITLHPSKNKVAYIEHNKLQQPIFYFEGGIHQQPLLRFFNLIDAFQQYYYKSIISLFIFRQSQYRHDNKMISELMDKLKKRVRAIYGGTKVLYAWAREQKTENSGLHYHIAIGVNGSLCRNAHTILKEAQIIWVSLDKGNRCMLLPKNPLYKLMRTDDEINLRAVKMRCSYAFKAQTKELIPPYIRKFGFSQFSSSKQKKNKA